MTRTVALLKASNRQVFYVPTLYTYVAIDWPGQNPIPERERKRAREVREIGYAGFRRALSAGLPIGFGTDAQVIPHGGNAKEFSERSKLGESHMASADFSGVFEGVLFLQIRLRTFHFRVEFLGLRHQ